MNEIGPGSLSAYEKEVLVSLADAWNKWLSLPHEHADDVPQFRALINALQMMVGFRAAVRANPEVLR